MMNPSIESDSLLLKFDPFWVKVTIFSLIVVLGGEIFLFFDSFLMLWMFLSILTVLGIISSVISLLPNTSFLKLTKEGFEIKNSYQSSFVKWSDVEVFRFAYNYNIGPNRVVFTFSKGCNPYKLTKILSYTVVGNQADLPNNYGMKPRELAQLMNEWRLKYSS